MSKNLNYYFHCRNKLGVRAINIYNELLELFEQEVIPSVQDLISLQEKYLQLSHKDFKLEASKVKLDKFKFKIDYSEDNSLRHIQFYSLCRFQLVRDTMVITKELKKLFKTVPDEKIIIKWSFTFWTETNSKYRPSSQFEIKEGLCKDRQPNEMDLKEKNRQICVKNEEANFKILELNAEVARLNNDRKNRDKSDKYEELLNEYKQEISVKDAKAEESKLKIAELGNEIKILNKKFSAQLDTNIKNEEKITELEQLVKKYKEEIIINETKAKESISKIDELEKGKNNNAEQINLQMENLRKEINRLKYSLSKEQEISSYNKEEFEYTTNKLKEEINANSIKYEKLNKDFTKLQTEYNQEETNFKEIKKFNKIEIDKQEKQNIDLRLSNDSKETEINNLKKELEMSSTNFNDLQQSQQLKENEQRFDLIPKLNKILKKSNYLLNLLKNQKEHNKIETIENSEECLESIEESLKGSKQMVVTLLREKKKIESDHKKLNFYYSKLSESNNLTEQLLRVKSDTIENLQKDLIRDRKGKRSSCDEEVIILEHLNSNFQENNKEFKEEKFDPKKVRNH